MKRQWNRKNRLALVDDLFTFVKQNLDAPEYAEIVSNVALVYAQAQNGRIERRLLDWCSSVYRDKRYRLWKLDNSHIVFCALLDVADKWDEFAC